MVDEIISGMMAANETLGEDAQALKSTGRTHMAYGSMVKAGGFACVKLTARE